MRVPLPFFLIMHSWQYFNKLLGTLSNGLLLLQNSEGISAMHINTLTLVTYHIMQLFLVSCPNSH